MGLDDEAPLTDQERELFDALVEPLSRTRTGRWMRTIRARYRTSPSGELSSRSRRVASVAVAASILLVVPALTVGVPVAFLVALMGAGGGYVLATHRPDTPGRIRGLLAGRIRQLGRAIAHPG